MFRKKRLTISKTLFSKLEKISKEKGFPSIEDFTESLLNNYIYENEKDINKEVIKEKLEKLGYL